MIRKDAIHGELVKAIYKVKPPKLDPEERIENGLILLYICIVSGLSIVGIVAYLAKVIRWQ